MRKVQYHRFADFTTVAKQTCSVEWIVIQCDGAEGKLHGSTCNPLIDHCKEQQRAEYKHHIKSCCPRSRWVMCAVRVASRAFVLAVDVVADVQVQVGDLQVVGRLAHVVSAEQLRHRGALVCRRRCLLASHLLRRRGRRRHLQGEGFGLLLGFSCRRWGVLLPHNVETVRLNRIMQYPNLPTDGVFLQFEWVGLTKYAK